MSEIKTKSEKLAEKFNLITSKISESIGNADALMVDAEDISDEVNEIIEEIPQEELNVPEVSEIINLQNLLEDFKYVRQTLKENTELGKNMLKAMGSELECEPNPKMLESYALLQGTLTDNLKLFLQSYKDISNVMMNISKIANKNPTTQNITNINIEAEQHPINTAELIKELSGKTNE